MCGCEAHRKLVNCTCDCDHSDDRISQWKARALAAESSKGATYPIATDQIKYLAKVAEWIESVPDGTTSYGEFYVQRIPVYYDKDLVGEFVDEGGFWCFEFGSP
jgi:hypothetical protein